MHKETKDRLHHIQIVKKETPLVENHCMCEGHSMSFKDQFGKHAHKYAHAHTWVGPDKEYTVAEIYFHKNPSM